MKVAIVHDFLFEYGGAERVVESLHQLFPQAPVYVAFYHLENFFSKKNIFSTMDLRPTYMQKIPFITKFYSPLRLIAPHAFSKLDLSSYDLIISSSNSYHAKSIRPPAKALHFCYCHTPARSLYGFDTSSNWQKQKLISFFGNLINHFLRLTDYQAAQKVNQIIVNSAIVQARVKKYWRRKSIIIYPPVALVDQVNNQTLVSSENRKYFLFVGRLNYAKHPEIALQACLDLNLPLKIIGQGPLTEYLKDIIKKDGRNHQIEFLGAVDDQQLIDCYAHARALIFPAVDEDFGITPIEAMALGTPVISHRSGGPLETIVEHKTGIFFDEVSVDCLKKSLNHFQTIEFKHDFIRQSAQKFSQKIFHQKVLQLVNSAKQKIGKNKND